MAKCIIPALFRYTWPGEIEKQICALHRMQVDAVANALGLPLQFIQLTMEEMISGQCHMDEMDVEQEKVEVL